MRVHIYEKLGAIRDENIAQKTLLNKYCGTNIAKNIAENIAETGFRSDPQMINW